MKNTLILLFSILSLSLFTGCSAAPSPTSSASPVKIQSPAIANPSEGEAHLRIAAFKVIMKHQGQTMTITGDEQGKLTIGNKEEVETLQVSTDGRLEGDLMSGSSCVLGSDGVLYFDKRASPLKVTEDGNIQVNDKLFFRREGKAYIEVQARPGSSKIEFEVEGPPEADRLMAYLVALSTYMLEGEALESSPLPDVTATPDPTK